MKNIFKKGKSDIYEALFCWGMVWRIIYGALRLIFGLIFLRILGTPLAEIFFNLSQHELTEDPNDWLIGLLTPFFQHTTLTVTFFLAFYLIFWSMIDILLSINMLRKKTWAFPISIVLISIFIFYEIFRFFHTHSLILFFVIIIDIILVWLIKREYEKIDK